MTGLNPGFLGEKCSRPLFKLLNDSRERPAPGELAQLVAC